MKYALTIVLVGCGLLGGTTMWVCGQSGSRKPIRAEAPDFSKSDFSNVFFDDVRSVLKGQRPSAPTSANATSAASVRPAPTSPSSPVPTTPGSNGVAAKASGWADLISPATLEDTVKGSKLRLDKIVTTPAKFAGGGYAEARREYSLQALLFTIIEQYPTNVRWKASSSIARERFSRMAANAKVGSPQAYSEAKQRLQDLGDLLNGSQLAGTSNREISWEHVIDRGPLMQTLEATFKEQIQVHSANPSAFSSHREELLRAAELVSVLGAAAIKEGMPDAADEEYKAFANSMIDGAKQIAVAVQSDNADQARKAAGQVGQSCVKCHDAYR